MEQKIIRHAEKIKFPFPFQETMETMKKLQYLRPISTNFQRKPIKFRLTCTYSRNSFFTSFKNQFIPHPSCLGYLNTPGRQNMGISLEIYLSTKYYAIDKTPHKHCIRHLLAEEYI